MFYSQFILAKKGPLGTIWIAAHLERKLRKNQVADTDIGTSVDSIIFPEVPIALRLSSHLLLGVVKIYSKKVNYLFDDCSEALLKIKQAFRSAAVDLPPEESTAPYHSITLPETFDLDDFELPDNELFQSNFVDHHVSTREQITLQDTLVGVAYATSQFGLDERFGDGDISQIGLDVDEDMFGDKVLHCGVDGVATDLEVDAQATVQPMTPLKNDEINVGTTEVSDVMADECSRFQMQGTTMIMDLNEVADTPFTAEVMNDGRLGDENGIFGSDDFTNMENNSSPESPFPINNENSFSSTDFNLSTELHTPVLFQHEVATVNEDILSKSSYNSDQDKITPLGVENINRGARFLGQIDMNNDLTNNKDSEQYISSDNGNSGTSCTTHNCSAKNSSIFEVISGKSDSLGNSWQFSGGIASNDHAPCTPVSSNPCAVLTQLGEHYSAVKDLVSNDVCVVAPHGCVDIGKNDTQTCKEPGSLLEVKFCSYVHTEHSINMNVNGSALPLPFPRPNTVIDTDLPTEEVTVRFSCPPDDSLKKMQPPFLKESSTITDSEKCLDNPCEFVSTLTPKSDCANTMLDMGFILGNGSHDFRMARLDIETVAVKNGSVMGMYESDIDQLHLPGISNDSEIGNHELKNSFGNSSTCGEVSSPSKVVTKSTFPNSDSHDYAEILKNVSGVCPEPMDYEISNPFTPVQVSDNRAHILQQCSSRQDSSFPEVENLFKTSSAMPGIVRRSTLVSSGEKSGSQFSGKNPISVSVELRDSSVVEKHIDNEILREAYAENIDMSTEFDVTASEKFLSVPSDIQKFPFLGRNSTTGENFEGVPNVSANVTLNSGKPQNPVDRYQTPQTPVFSAVSGSIIMDRENMLDVSDTGYLTGTANDCDSTMLFSGGKHAPMTTTSKRSRQTDISFGSHHSNRTIEFMADDDDLLSSILVGQRSSSVLKLKPTPRSEVPPCKRIRFTPIASASKRKVLVDDTLILHGDAMRNQLTSTEDIRRMRKKAPCTRSEIWLTHIQSIEDEIFDEPTHTGVSPGLFNLNNSNLINISVINENAPPLEYVDINPDMRAVDLTTTKDSNGYENINPVQLTRSFERIYVNNSSIGSTELIDSCVRSGNSLCGVKESESDKYIFLKHSFGSLDSSVKSDAILKPGGVSTSDGNNPTSPSVEIKSSLMQSDACPSGIRASRNDESKPSGISVDILSVVTCPDGADYTMRRDEDDIHVDVQPTSTVHHTHFQCREVNTCINVSTETHASSPKMVSMEPSPKMDSMEPSPKRESMEPSPKRESMEPSPNRESMESSPKRESVESSKKMQRVMEIDGKTQNLESTSDVYHGKNICECDPVHTSTPLEKVYEEDSTPSVIPGALTVNDASIVDVNGGEKPLDDLKSTLKSSEEPSFDRPTEQNDLVMTPFCADLGNEGSCVTNMARETQLLDGFNSFSGDAEKGICEDSNSRFINNVSGMSPSASHVVECETHRESCSIEDGENSNCQVATTNHLNLGSTTTNPTVAESGMGNLVYQEDTDFLKRDYESYIEGSDTMLSTEEKILYENSGWSSRTKAVAKYLQAWFCDDFGHRTTTPLPLDGILSGKTRKEASRMFFETLVLKSRDYVEVEQEKAFGKIEIKAGGKLMKE